MEKNTWSCIFPSFWLSVFRNFGTFWWSWQWCFTKRRFFSTTLKQSCPRLLQICTRQHVRRLFACLLLLVDWNCSVWLVVIWSCCNLFAVRCLLFFVVVVVFFWCFWLLVGAWILDTWLTRLCMKPASRTNLTVWSDWLDLNLSEQKEQYVMHPLAAMYQW